MKRLGAFVLGGFVGFGFGVYHGYNYALDQYKKVLYHHNVQYERKVRDDYQDKRLENLVLVNNSQSKYHVVL